VVRLFGGGGPAVVRLCSRFFLLGEILVDLSVMVVVVCGGPRTGRQRRALLVVRVADRTRQAHAVVVKEVAGPALGARRAVAVGRALEARVRLLLLLLLAVLLRQQGPVGGGGTGTG
jgi:hypothetical protein